MVAERAANGHGWVVVGRFASLLAVIALTGALAACGSDHDPAAPKLTKAEAAALAARRAAERPHFARGPATRPALVRSVERSILADARSRAAHHRLDGPFLRTDCKVTRDDLAYARENPNAPILRYDCLALSYESKTKPRMQIGKLFTARVDFRHASYAWCLRTPVGGEGAHQSAIFDVKPSPMCVAPPPGE